MAAKGGGSWKVAYADFVTAMMAFFLVMWICAQDQKMKEAVAHYFMDPLGGSPVGAASKPGKNGSLFERPGTGSVPNAESSAMGRGRGPHTRAEAGRATKLVADWVHTDDEIYTRWHGYAQRAMEEAEGAPEVRERQATATEVAARLLAKRLQEEVSRNGPETGLHRDLLQNAIAEVNWVEIAEDLLARLD